MVWVPEYYGVPSNERSVELALACACKNITEATISINRVYTSKPPHEIGFGKKAAKDGRISAVVERSISILVELR